MHARPSPVPRPERETRRFTIDIPAEDHRALRSWSVDAEVPASLLVLALLDLARNDPAIRVRADRLAIEQLSARRAVGQ
jgi:hypothetical protein